MPLITPFNDGNIPEELQESINEVLDVSGLNSKPKSNRVEDAREVFNAAGASLDSIAQNVANIMARGETDAGRLKATELAMKVHGILNDMDEKQIPDITINVQGDGNKTLINLVLPSI